MDKHQMLEEWHFRVRRSHFAHHTAAANYEKMNRYLGIPAIILSTIVGTTIFATLQQSTSIYIEILVGLFSISAAVLTSLNTFLGYSERADKHKIAAVKYGDLRTEIEQYMRFPSEENFEKVLESFRNRWKKQNEESPIISEKLWKQVEKAIGTRSRGPAKS